MSADIEGLLYQKLAYASSLMGKTREDVAPETLHTVAKEMAIEIENAVMSALNAIGEKHDKCFDAKEVAETIAKVFEGADNVT